MIPFPSDLPMEAVCGACKPLSPIENFFESIFRTNSGEPCTCADYDALHMYMIIIFGIIAIGIIFLIIMIIKKTKKRNK